jgi:formylglycine-generating enzyme required for sulfatase activity
VEKYNMICTVDIPCGDYEIGVPGEDVSDDIPYLKVRLTKRVQIGKCPISQGEWIAVMGEGQYLDSELMNKAKRHGAEHVQWGSNYPAIYINKWQAVEFCRRYSAMISQSVRLPTDSEWEIACRGGVNGRWLWGDQYDHSIARAYAWYGQLPRVARIHECGLLRANGYGLYDMAGNVREWVLDEVAILDSMMPHIKPCSDLEVDPIWKNGEYAITRGGCVTSSILSLMTSNKNCTLPSVANGDIGFRIVVER